MSIEAWKYLETEKKKKEFSEKKEKEARRKILAEERKKWEVREHVKAEEALGKLKDLLKDHNLDLSAKDLKSVEKALSWEELNTDEIEEILNKIDEIENTEWVDKYLSEDSRITKEEYKKALVDDVFRVQIITKLDNALTILAKHVAPDATMWLNLFSWYMAILDKKLIYIQENHIDIKDNLKSIDNKDTKDTKDKKSLWERFLEFLKELTK